MSIEVECYSGYRAEERPVRLRIDGRGVDVRLVLRQWREPDGDGFEVECDDGLRYLLRRDRTSGMWRVRLR